MSTRGWLAVLSAVAAIAWIRLTGVPEAARVWTVALLVILPAVMIHQGRLLSQLEELPRREAYISSIVSLWMLAIATIGVAWLSGYEFEELGLIALDPLLVTAYAAGLTLAGVAVLFAFRFAGVHEPPIVRQLMPVSRQDRILFVGVSITAGICEEIVYRGFLIHVLYSATGSITMALLLSSGAFGVAHAYQQPIGALRATLLGLILALPLVIDGSIVPAILAHVAIDILSGLWLSRYLLR